MTTDSPTFLISASLGVRVLDKDGWRAPSHGECIDTGDGNELQVNAEGYWSGYIHGASHMLLVAMVLMGIVAWIVEYSK